MSGGDALDSYWKTANVWIGAPYPTYLLCLSCGNDGLYELRNGTGTNGEKLSGDDRWAAAVVWLI